MGFSSWYWHIRLRSWSVNVLRPDGGVGIGTGAGGADWVALLGSTGVVNGAIGLGVIAGAEELDWGVEDGGLIEGFVN